MASVQQLRNDTLLGLFHERKAALDAAKLALDEVGEEIANRTANLTGGDLECSSTWSEGGYKATVVFALNRKLDVEAIRANWAQLPGSVQAAIAWKAELRVGEYRKLEGRAAEVMQECILETKPAKPSVKVVSVKPGN